MHNNSREKLREIYQREDNSQKTFIPAKPKVDPNERNRFFRVCAYCRVSTDSDEQLSSYELQQAHYLHLVEDHPNWELRHIYADEGISGTSLKKRDQFVEMIEACKHGEYDLIVTKSVSRFARNLVDCISIIRMLKGLPKPVGVYFETDNLNTLGENNEFMLSFLATFAQEESVKKSEAMNWSLMQRFKDGKLLTPALLGYDRPKDVTGRYIKYAPLKINESEAAIVRFIYDAKLRQRALKFRCRNAHGSPVRAFSPDIKRVARKPQTEARTVALVLIRNQIGGFCRTADKYRKDPLCHRIESAAVAHLFSPEAAAHDCNNIK